MSLCARCRLSLRRALVPQKLLPQTRYQSTASAAPASTIKDILSKPSWSIRSLLAPPDASSNGENCSPSKVTPSQLHHLLRLSALPLPTSKAEEDTMIETLERQLHFVRAVQQVDTAGVEPLRAIRDETEQGVREATVTLEDLKDALDGEELIGFYKRPRRVRRERVDGEAAEMGEEGEEDWDALKMASRKAGRFFVVQSKKGDADNVP